MYLSSVADERDNNFNLIRILAALSVLVSHCFALSTGNPNTEPFRLSLGITPGSIAVDIFFVTSGFLVTASLLRSQNIVDFTCARILRIYPALWVMLIFTVFGLGTLFTSTSLADYLSSPQIYVYLLKCGTLFNGVNYLLPGVFKQNAYGGAVNGSLWTMPQEVKMYGILAMFWIAARVASGRRTAVLKTVVVSAAAMAMCATLWLNFARSGQHIFTQLFAMFFTGASFYILRERIVLRPITFWTALTAIVVSAQIDRGLFFVAYTMSIAYVLFYLAYVPDGRVRSYNRFGDYSYGIYIYAFPIKQAVAALWPGLSPAVMFVLSAPITVVVAAMSWHFLESPVLRNKHAIVRRAERLLLYSRR